MDPRRALTPDRSTDADDLRDTYRQLRDDGHTVTCGTCNAEPMTPDRIVAAYPLPWSEVVENEVLCHECWARDAAAETILDEKQAQLLAAQAVGFDQPEMASAIGGYEDEVTEGMRELSETRRDVEDQMDDLMRTAKLFEYL